jgi:Zn-dependent peptidase ImmA (M78 family)
MSPLASDVSITPSVLRWAVESSGMDAEEVARRVKCAPEHLSAWMEGNAQPTRGQFTRLVNTLRRPSATFFLPHPPLTEDFHDISFRSPRGNKGDAELTKELRLHLRKAVRIQKFVSWIARSEGEAVAELPEHSIKVDAVEAGEEFRENWSNLSLEVQLRWADEWEALRAWRQSLEALRLLVLQYPLRQTGPRGFSLADEYAPLVAINSAYSATARIYSLLHEVGHLVTKTNSACWGFAQSSPWGEVTERWCEEFAASALMPSAAFLDWIDEHEGGYLSEPQQARAAANRFKVSIRAASLRAIDLRRADKGLYAKVDRLYQASDFPGQSGGGGGLARPRKRIQELGLRTPRLIESAIDRGLVSTREALDYLDVTIGEYDDLTGFLLEGDG